MRALVFDKPGDAAAVLRLGEAPEPVLQPNGVLIEVRARVIQPAERIYPVPDGIADEIACQFPLNPLTAWGLLDVCSLSSESACDVSCRQGLRQGRSSPAKGCGGARLYSQAGSLGSGPSYFSIVPPQRVQGGSSCPFLTCMMCPHFEHL